MYYTADPSHHSAQAAQRFRELNQHAARRKSESEFENLASSIEAGLRTAMSASPDLYRRFSFSPSDMAAAAAQWLLSQPRR
jgi:hypothetical protein